MVVTPNSISTFFNKRWESRENLSKYDITITNIIHIYIYIYTRLAELLNFAGRYAMPSGGEKQSSFYYVIQ